MLNPYQTKLTSIGYVYKEKMVEHFLIMSNSQDPIKINFFCIVPLKP